MVRTQLVGYTGIKETTYYIDKVLKAHKNVINATKSDIPRKSSTRESMEENQGTARLKKTKRNAIIENLITTKKRTATRRKTPRMNLQTTPHNKSSTTSY